MNIGIIHGFVGGGGGTEKILLTIIESLENSDHNVTLYTFSKPKLSYKNIKIKSIIPIHIPLFGLYQRALESKLISKAKDENLLIQASGGLNLPKNPNQKIIVYCHGDFSNELNNSNTKYKGIWSLYYKSYLQIVKQFIVNILDPRIHLISNSKFTHDLIKLKYNKDSTVFYPPVNLNEFSSTKKENSIVTIGRFSKEKNLEFGLNVMKDVNSKYYVIGNTKTKTNLMYYKKLQSIINDQHLNKNIYLLKNIERKKLVNFLNTSKIYFHCSPETFGITVAESIAAGCIPIVPNNSAHIETVPFNELRYTPNDILDASEKLKNALDGKYDQLQKRLINNINMYDKNYFKDSIIKYIENLS